MNTQESKVNWVSRRDLLIGSAALLAGGFVGGPGPVSAKTDAVLADSPPLPWRWVRLDPTEAGRRAYRLYFDSGGCGTASYLSILSMLREEVGHPWTSLPDMMMIHAAGGYGAYGTLCGALGGASCIINLATYRSQEDTFYRSMIDWLYTWYAEQEFPTARFDDISKMPNQIRVKASSPLCHTSVTSWTLAANEEATSDAKKERCAKVSGEVVYTVVDRLNRHFADGWAPPAWQPSAATAHCVKCHGPDTGTASKAGLNHQQGHMECLMCHDKHPTWN